MPILLPLTTALTGGLIGFLALSSYRRKNAQSRAALVVLLLVAATAAAIPNLGQQLYDLGLSFPTIKVLEGFSYFVFGFAAAGAWALLEPSRNRWALLILLPVSFAQPALWTFAHVAWTLNGFAP